MYHWYVITLSYLQHSFKIDTINMNLALLKNILKGTKLVKPDVGIFE